MKNVKVDYRINTDNWEITHPDISKSYVYNLWS